LESPDLLIVNECGEYHFVSSQDFERLISHKLKSDEPLFLDLKGKHFVTDTELELPIKLLATKYRTKKGFLRDFTSLHMMVITLRCNHRCEYCQVSSEESGAYKWDMGISTARKVVDMIFQSPSPEIKIEFQGGEPLLNWDAIKSTIVYAEEKNQSYGKKLEFVICTNLTTIDEEKLHYIKEHNVNLSTSLDGPRFVHDQGRRLRAEGSSYDLFLEKLDLSRKVIGTDRISALMTTTKFSLTNMREVIDEYMRLGFSGIFIRALNPYGFAWKDYEAQAYGVEEFLKGYYDALDYIIDCNLRGEWFPEYYATLVLTRMLTPFSTGFVDLQSPSGAGISGVIYDYNGDVYPADEARMLARMGDQKFLMGNVKENTYHEIFNGPVIRNIVNKSCVECMPGCFSCPLQIYCGADPVRNHLERNDIIGHRPTSDFCKKNHGIIRHLFAKLKENDPEVMNVFWSWITNRPINRMRCENI